MRSRLEARLARLEANASPGNKFSSWTDEQLADELARLEVVLELQDSTRLDRNIEELDRETRVIQSRFMSPKEIIESDQAHERLKAKWRAFMLQKQ